MKTVENLEAGEMLITEVKMVNGGKVQLEFAQMVVLPNANKSILGLLNASDERFNSQPRARRAWLSGMPSDIEKVFNIKLDGLVNVGDVQALNILNPELGGQRLNIQFKERTDGTDYEMQNLETSAKRAGKDGDYIYTADGAYIFTDATVVTGEPKHFFFENTRRGEVVSASQNVLNAIESEIGA